MTEIIIATKNKHKVSEMSELLGGFADKICFKSLDDIGFDERKTAQLLRKTPL